MFLPDRWLEYIRLLGVKKHPLGVWISAIFWVSFSIIVIDSFGKCVHLFEKKRKERKQRENREAFLESLSSDEKIVVRRIFDLGHCEFEISDSIIDKLNTFGVVMHPKVSTESYTFSYYLQPWAVEYLKKHPNYGNKVSSDLPEALKGSNNGY